MSSEDQVTDSALRLPPEERARLANRLLESLEESELDPEIEAAWEKEVARRIRDLLEGRASTVPAEVALRTARAKLSDRR